MAFERAATDKQAATALVRGLEALGRGIKQSLLRATADSLDCPMPRRSLPAKEGVRCPLFTLHSPHTQLLFALLLLTAIALVYGPALQGGFVWDDHAILLQNRLIREPGGLARIWFSTQPTDYFPLTWTLLWFEWRIFGETPWGYHLFNLALHACNALLVRRVLRRLRVPLAWFAAVLFALHPVNVTSAAWISEHKNTLSTLFFLLAADRFLSFLHHRTDIAARNHGLSASADAAGAARKAYALTLVLFTLALLAKTAVVVLPPLLLLTLWWRGKLDKRRVLETAPFFALALLFGLVTVWFQQHNAIANDIPRTDAFLSRMATAGKAVWFYLGKALVPVNLSFIYPRWELPARLPRDLAPGLALAALLFGAARLRTRESRSLVFGLGATRLKPGAGLTRASRALVFGLGCFVCCLLPVLGFFNMYFMQFALVADHWQYLATIPIMGLLAAGLAHAAAHLRKPHRLTLPVAALTIGLFAVQSHIRAGIFADEIRLWRDTIQHNPSSFMPRNNLGIALLARNRCAEAACQFSEALQLKPDYWLAHYNLGNTYLKWDDPARAVRHYSEALRLEPRHGASLNNMGYAHARLDNPSGAAAFYSRALVLYPHYATAHSNLGDLMLRQNRLERAIHHYSQVLRTDPDDAETHLKLAACFLKLAEKEDNTPKEEPKREGPFLNRE